MHAQVSSQDKTGFIREGAPAIYFWEPRCSLVNLCGRDLSRVFRGEVSRRFIPDRALRRPHTAARLKVRARPDPRADVPHTRTLHPRTIDRPLRASS